MLDRRPAGALQVYCPYNQTSCYIWASAGTTFGAVASACQAYGGYLASWNDGAEQLQVENFFGVGATAWQHHTSWCHSANGAVCLLTRLTRAFMCAVQSTGVRTSLYWMGLSFDSATSKWTWADGTDIGNGGVSNANPYAHWCAAVPSGADIAPLIRLQALQSVRCSLLCVKPGHRFSSSVHQLQQARFQH